MKRSLTICCSLALFAATTMFAQDKSTVQSQNDVITPVSERDGWGVRPNEIDPVDFLDISEDKYDNFMMQAYPNPSNGEFKIKLPPRFKNLDVNIDVYTIGGKMVRSVLFPGSLTVLSMDLTDQDPGLYLIVARTDQHVQTDRIVIR